MKSTGQKPPAFGSFAVSLEDKHFLADVDAVLSGFLGTRAHRAMLADFGFSDEEVDLVTTDQA